MLAPSQLLMTSNSAQQLSALPAVEHYPLVSDILPHTPIYTKREMHIYIFTNATYKFKYGFILDYLQIQEKR